MSCLESHLSNNPKYIILTSFIFSVTTGVTKGLASVKSNFARYGLLDDKIQFLQGWFDQTIPKAKINKLCMLRLDGDTYPSTIDGLNLCYDNLSVGGFCIVDDYFSLDGM